MRIFNKKSEMLCLEYISLIINKLKFFDMSKITTKNPVLKRNGVNKNYVLIINRLKP